ncbi:hypothetical protein GH714_006616 [Hevea brasiliensis]|uniref:J domain-containing protein n=1 Tax=Hevea brasiliensis TaxID=3981 RepID=A0A6A6N1E8_HEVBR|nr:hypothetical protein GH714_006616 [Hevea brasiliensis]
MLCSSSPLYDDKGCLVIGAKRFALKAQNLYPGLEGLPQMVATFDVHISAENKINGEEDWYGILGVNPKADDENVRKQYRKLALLLHPDKNKSIGADGAFKLISQAWSLLSDKSKRAAHDMKRRNAKVFQKASNPLGVHQQHLGLVVFTICQTKCEGTQEYSSHRSFFNSSCIS